MGDKGVLANVSSCVFLFFSSHFVVSIPKLSRVTSQLPCVEEHSNWFTLPFVLASDLFFTETTFLFILYPELVFYFRACQVLFACVHLVRKTGC